MVVDGFSAAKRYPKLFFENSGFRFANFFYKTNLSKNNCSLCVLLAPPTCSRYPLPLHRFDSENFQNIARKIQENGNKPKRARKLKLALLVCLKRWLFTWRLNKSTKPLQGHLFYKTSEIDEIQQTNIGVLGIRLF